MLTKERCMSLLDDIAEYAYDANIGPHGINEINEDYNGLKKLIEEHFTPQSLEFKDLKEGMYVLDWSLKNIIQIVKLHRSERIIIYKDFENEDKEIFTDYRKNRFYPIAIPNVGRD